MTLLSIWKGIEYSNRDSFRIYLVAISTGSINVRECQSFKSRTLVSQSTSHIEVLGDSNIVRKAFIRRQQLFLELSLNKFMAYRTKVSVPDPNHSVKVSSFSSMQKDVRKWIQTNANGTKYIRLWLLRVILTTWSPFSSYLLLPPNNYTYLLTSTTAWTVSFDGRRRHYTRNLHLISNPSVTQSKPTAEHNPR